MKWIHENNQINRSFKFRNFVHAFSFMTEVAFAAERLEHHPKWTNVYNTVDVSLSTHDAGNIVTEKDWKLAKDIDLIYEKYS